jgi:hypothetical protein
VHVRRCRLDGESFVKLLNNLPERVKRIRRFKQQHVHVSVTVGRDGYDRLPVAPYVLVDPPLSLAQQLWQVPQIWGRVSVSHVTTLLYGNYLYVPLTPP